MQIWSLSVIGPVSEMAVPWWGSLCSVCLLLETLNSIFSQRVVIFCPLTLRDCFINYHASLLIYNRSGEAGVVKESCGVGKLSSVAGPRAFPSCSEETKAQGLCEEFFCVI